MVLAGGDNAADIKCLSGTGMSVIARASDENFRQWERLSAQAGLSLPIYGPNSNDLANEVYQRLTTP